MWLNGLVSAWTTLMGTVLCLSGAALAAYDRSPDAAAVNDAIAIGLSRSEVDRARFHAPYRVDVQRAPVDSIEVITPFRRIVLSAESHTQAGGRLYGQRDALAVVSATANQLDVVVELTFHPLNTFVGVPAYSVVVAGADDIPLAAVSAERVPRFGARVAGPTLPYPYGGANRPPTRSEPLTGGTIVARFDAALLDARGVYDVLVAEGSQEVARARIALGALR